MPQATDLKRGVRIELDDGPYTVLEVASQSPSARGGATLVKFKARHMVSGRFRSEAVKASDFMEEADVGYQSATYLYRDDDFFHFMDGETYEQHALSPDAVGEAAGFLLDGAAVRLLLYNERAVALELPNTLELTITETEPAVRGDTVSAVTKAATLETGAVVQVPMFVAEGDRIKVDTRDGRYLGRA